MPHDPRSALLACADGDIAEGALWLAAEDVPGVDVPRWLALVDELGEELRARRGGVSGAAAVPVVAGLLRDRLNLHGTGGADPRAHYLHEVLSRGAGIPIACSAIWIAAGSRAGLEVEGIGLPGHFVVRLGPALVDPFTGGQVLDEAAVRRLLTAVLGTAPERVDPAALEPAGTREMLARMSRNLRACYAARNRWDLAVRAADRCVALLPERVEERRDRGLLLWRAGRAVAALEDLSTYLDEVPDPPDRSSVEEARARLRAFLN